MAANHPPVKLSSSRRLQAAGTSGARRELGPIRDGHRSSLERSHGGASPSTIAAPVVTASPITIAATASMASIITTRSSTSKQHMLHHSLSAPITLALTTSSKDQPESSFAGSADRTQARQPAGKLVERGSCAGNLVVSNDKLCKMMSSVRGGNRPAVTPLRQQAAPAGSTPGRISKGISFAMQQRQAQVQAQAQAQAPALVQVQTASQLELSNDELVHSLEEQKVMQLKNVSPAPPSPPGVQIPNFPVRQKPPSHLPTPRLNMPNPHSSAAPPRRSDPPKRRTRRVSPMKRRSSSHSPKTMKKGARQNGGSSTDSDAEKRIKVRRRKSISKILGKHFAKGPTVEPANQEVTLTPSIQEVTTLPPAQELATLPSAHGLTTLPSAREVTIRAACFSPRITMVTTTSEICASVTKPLISPTKHVKARLSRKGSACLSKTNADVVDTITGVDMTSKDSDMVFADPDIMPDDLLRTCQLRHPNTPLNEPHLKSSASPSMPEDATAPSSPASPTPWI